MRLAPYKCAAALFAANTVRMPEEAPRGEGAPPSGWKRFVAGTVGGVCQVLVGHPFQTVKARLQAQGDPPKYKGGLHCMRVTMREEGFGGLYKGIGPPMAGVGTLSAVLFYANGAALQLLTSVATVADNAEVVPWAADDQPSNAQVGVLLQVEQEPPLKRVAAAGFMAGVAQAVVCTPVELVMIQLQTQHMLTAAGGAQQFSGPVDCAKKLVSHGGVGALFRGYWATVLRDGPNYFSYFLGYETAKRAFMRARGLKPGQEHELQAWELLSSGGFAGICAQLTQLPMDVVKTRIQSENILKQAAGAAQPTVLQVAKDLVRANGIGGFYKGLGPVLARAFPANAVTFFGFEATMRFLTAD
eukprot:scaffold175_cov414-Prasinococcus_capsulatus_cf.AAC.15